LASLVKRTSRSKLPGRLRSSFATLRDELLAEIETIAPVVREYASQSEQIVLAATWIKRAIRA
jgi:hypothetical protein